MPLYRLKANEMELNFFNINNKIETLKIEVGKYWSDIKTSNVSISSIFSKIDDGDNIISEDEIITLNKAIEYVESNSNNTLEQNKLKELQKLDFSFLKNLSINEILIKFLDNDNSIGFEISADKILKYIDMMPEDELASLININTSYINEIFQNFYNKNNLSQEHTHKSCKLL